MAMEEVRAHGVSKSLELMRPSMDFKIRIAVMGAGPSGLSAAQALTKLGYKNVTVLEENSTLTSMLASEMIEGRVYDLGGQVMSRVSCPTLNSLMVDMQVQAEDLSHHRLTRIDMNTGEYEDLDMTSDFLSVSGITAELQVAARRSGKLGVQSVCSQAYELAPGFLERRGFENGVPKSVAYAFTAAGYGYVEDMPYAYVHEFLNTTAMQKLWRAEGGYRRLWKEVANSLPDVRCGVKILNIDRSDDRVRVVLNSSDSAQPTTEILEFDKLILTGRTYPSLSSSRTYRPSSNRGTAINGVLRYTAEEEVLFSRVQTIEFYTTVLKISGLDLPEGVSYPEAADDPCRIGHFVAVQRFYAETNIYVFWSYGDADTPQDTITQRLHEDVKLLGGQVEALVLQRKWSCFPHVSSTDMAEGFYDRLEDLQGKNNTYYVGGLMAYELTTERNVAYAMHVVGRAFGLKRQPAPIKKLMECELPWLEVEGEDYKAKTLQEIPNFKFPDLPSIDEYLSFYAKHPVLSSGLVYIFVDESGKESNRLTYSELDARVSNIATRLLACNSNLEPGDRVLLIYPPGLEFIQGFLGCLRARIVPVPVLPPDPLIVHDQALVKVSNIAKACQAKALLSTVAYHRAVRAGYAPNFPRTNASSKPTTKWPNLPWYDTDSWCRYSRSSSKWMHLRLSKSNDSDSFNRNGMETPSFGSSPTNLFLCSPQENATTPASTPETGVGTPFHFLGSPTEYLVTPLSGEKIESSTMLTSTQDMVTSSNSSPLSPSSWSPGESKQVSDAKASTHLSKMLSFLSPRGCKSSSKVWPNLENECTTAPKCWEPLQPKEETDTFKTKVSSDDLCFLQFTSGSTGEPKGVMIRHGAVMHNLKSMRKMLNCNTKSLGVSWIPHYHNMGLIGSFLSSLLWGGSQVIFGSATFMRKPLLWLELIDRYQATYAAAPNFAYDLVAKRYEVLKAAGREPKFDLSSLHFLGIAAEPVRQTTVRRFLELFHDSGVREHMLAPGYGLAENCLIVSVAYGHGKPLLTDIEGRICVGYVDTSSKEDMDVRIVNPESLEEVEAGSEGEIWISSASNAMDYWDQEELSKQTFHNRLMNADPESSCNTFLRTGDLGRVIEGNLFVTGRIKDLIIVYGRNIYPADVENVVENCSSAIRTNCSAVFGARYSIIWSKGVRTTQDDTSSDESGIVVVAEVQHEKKADPNVISVIKDAVASELGLQVEHVVLLKPHTIPKTYSGKIRRAECLKRYTDGSLEVVETKQSLKSPMISPGASRSQQTLRHRVGHQRSDLEAAPQDIHKTFVSSSSNFHAPKIADEAPLQAWDVRKSREDVMKFLVQILENRIGKTLNVDECFINHSMDSLSIVWVASKLSDFLGFQVGPMQIFTAGSISQLATSLFPENSGNTPKEINGTPKFQSSLREEPNLQTPRSEPASLREPQASVQTLSRKSREEILKFLVHIVEERLEKGAKVRVRDTVSSCGLDSMDMDWIASRLSEYVGFHVKGTECSRAGSFLELADMLHSGIALPASTGHTQSSQPRGGTLVSASPKHGRAENVSIRKSKEQIVQFLIQTVEQEIGDGTKVDPDESFDTYRVDVRVGMVRVASKVSEYLKMQVTPLQFYTAGCISELANTLVANATINAEHTAGRRSDPEEKIERDCITDDEFENDMSSALDPSISRQSLITVLQALGILYMAAVLIMPAVCIYGLIVRLSSRAGIQGFVWPILLIPVASVGYTAAVGLIISVITTGLLLPNFAVHSAIPLWSVKYVRWWIMYRLQDFASKHLASSMKGTVFLVWWYQLLGAQIGEDVHLATTDITDPSLLLVGNGAVIGEGATLQSHDVQEGLIRFSTIRIGRKSSIGPFSVVQRGTILGPGSVLAPLASTAVGQRIYGASSVDDSSSSYSQVKTSSSSAIRGVWQFLGLYLVGLTSTVSAVTAYAAFKWFALKLLNDLDSDGLASRGVSHMQTSVAGANGYVGFALAMTFPRCLIGVAPLMMFQDPSLLLHLLLQAAKHRKVISLLTCLGGAYLVYGMLLASFTWALKWCLVGKARTKQSVALMSRRGLQTWVVHALLQSLHEKFAFLLVGTEAMCVYLRSLGAEIGRMTSIRITNAVVDPDLLCIGNNSHIDNFANIITSTILPGGMMTSEIVSVGAGCAVGVQSVLMPGATMLDRSCLGAMSVASTGALLEEGGVYVGVEAPVMVYKQDQNGKKTSGRSRLSLTTDKDQRIEDMDPMFKQIVGRLAVTYGKKSFSSGKRCWNRVGVGATGTLRILDTVSKLPEHDVFKPGAMYVAALQHGSLSGSGDDRLIDIRGAELRIFHSGSQELPLLDLIMKTGKCVHVSNIYDFLGWMMQTQKERETSLQAYPNAAKNLWDSLRKTNSYSEMHYYSNACRFYLPTNSSQAHFVKFRLRPSDPKFGEDEGAVEAKSRHPPADGLLPADENDTRSSTCLRDDFTMRLRSSEGLHYILQIQLHPIPDSDSEREIVMDSTLSWDETKHPFVDVAELHLDEILPEERIEKIAFNSRNAPPSLAMIRATSARQSASLDYGRSVAYDIAHYLREAIPLPSAWQELIQFHEVGNVMNPDGRMKSKSVAACPGMSNCLPPEVSVFRAQTAESNLIKHVQSSKRENARRTTLTWDFLFVRLSQPFIQIVAPFALMLLSLYPSLLGLLFIGSKAGPLWMYALLPVAYLCSGLFFASLSVVSRWALVGRNRENTTTALWTINALKSTMWEPINSMLASLFLELGRGSLICNAYLQCLGASISSHGVYIDTLYSLNPEHFEIGAGSVIGRNAILLGHIQGEGLVTCKSNSIGEDCFLGTRALMLPGSKIENGGGLNALGFAMKDEVVTMHS